MFDRIFTLLFESGTAFAQLAALLVGLLIFGLGVLLSYDWIKWQMFARRTTAIIKGLQQKGEAFHPVFVFFDEQGQEQQARSSVGSSKVERKGADSNIEILYFPERPYDARPVSSIAQLAVGLLLTAPGGGILWFSFSQLNNSPMTWAAAVALAIYIALKIKKNIKPRHEWDTRESFRARKEAERKKELAAPLATEEQLQKVVEKQEKDSRTTIPILTVLSFCLMAGGGYFAWDMNELLRTGLRAEGKVVALEYVDDSDGSGTYKPVVTFTADGKKLRFKEKFSSNPPAYEQGEDVTVLYDPAHPEGTATIDKGLWNWALPGGLFGFGLLFFWGAMSLRRKYEQR